MDPGTGKLYTPKEVEGLTAEQRKRLVMLSGSEKSIREIAGHVEKATRGERRRAERKAQKLARRKNR